MLGLLLWGYIVLISFLVLVSVAYCAIAIIIELVTQLVRRRMRGHASAPARLLEDIEQMRRP